MAVPRSGYSSKGRLLLFGNEYSGSIKPAILGVGQVIFTMFCELVFGIVMLYGFGRVVVFGSIINALDELVNMEGDMCKALTIMETL